MKQPGEPGYIRPDRRVRAHELKAGDHVLILGDDGERHPETVEIAERDGRTIDVTYESGRRSVFGQNDQVYLKL